LCAKRQKSDCRIKRTHGKVVRRKPGGKYEGRGETLFGRETKIYQASSEKKVRPSGEEGDMTDIARYNCGGG